DAHAAFDLPYLARGIAQVVDRIFHAGFLPTQRYPWRARRAMRGRGAGSMRRSRSAGARAVRAIPVAGDTRALWLRRIPDTGGTRDVARRARRALDEARRSQC